jgi:hypothetical protein
MESKYLQVNTQKILFEEFEDEIVLVNTDSGFYYSLSGSGTRILRLLQSGCPAEKLAVILAGRAVNDSISREIESFVARLAEEEIIVPRQIVDLHPAETYSIDAAQPVSEGFERPVLERFDDVSELLLIDPVHQVDQEFGWPKAFREKNATEVKDRER